MRNPWLAIDASTEPAQRARELRHAWERFIGGDRVDSVRTPIVDSWRRSTAAGVDPSRDGSAPLVADDDEAAARWEVHPLVSTAFATPWQRCPRPDSSRSSAAAS